MEDVLNELNDKVGRESTPTFCMLYLGFLTRKNIEYIR